MANPRVYDVAQPLRCFRPWRGDQVAASVTKNAAAPQHRTVISGANSIREDPMTFVNFVKSFSRQEEGQDLLEYALLVALIALIAIVSVTAAGTAVSGIFSNIAGQLAGTA
jgi:pilus assembly protein Flp/PilA